MLVIRFFRTGKKNQPFFKIVVTEKNRPPRGGRFVEELGFYNPLTKEKNIKKDRVKYWISVGAQPSDTVYNLLVKEGIIEGKSIPLHKKKKVKKGSEEKPAEKPAEALPPQTEKATEEPKEEPKAEEKPEEKAKEENPAEALPPQTEEPAEKPVEKLDPHT